MVYCLIQIFVLNYSLHLLTESVSTYANHFHIPIHATAYSATAFLLSAVFIKYEYGYTIMAERGFL